MSIIKIKLRALRGLLSIVFNEFFALKFEFMNFEHVLDFLSKTLNENLI